MPRAARLCRQPARAIAKAEARCQAGGGANRALPRRTGRDGGGRQGAAERQEQSFREGAEDESKLAREGLALSALWTNWLSNLRLS